MPTQPAVTPHTIVLIGDLHKRHEEAYADAALKPGHLLKKNSDGEVLKHSTAGGAADVWFAKEDPLIGRTIDDAYSAGELVPYHMAQKGDLIYARVAASATAITKGASLESAGDGTLRVFGSGSILATAEEALDNSAGVTEAFIRARIR